MQSALMRLWYRGGAASWLLLPLSALYRGIVALRRGAYRRGWLRSITLPVPVVVVGNISVGGTGKTPLVIWLARTLSARGLRVGIVSRGYGGAGQPRPVSVRADSDPSQVGDEPVLIARRTGCPVVVCADRVAAAQRLVEQGVQLIVADDGLQHYRLGRSAELAVIDAGRGLGNGHCLPAGPLREPPARLQSVDAVIVNGDAGGAGRWPGALRMQLEPGPAAAVAGTQQRPLASFSGEDVHALAAIGNPQRFFDLLVAHGIRITPHALGDHAPLTRADIDFGDTLPVLMTEKDAVKCTAFADRRHWSVPVDARFSQGDGAELIARIANLARLTRLTGVS